MDKELGTGYLIVKTSTAGGALPVADSTVRIFSDEGVLLRTLTTDKSGLTERIALETPPKEMSQTYGNERPYATYIVDARHDGFYNVQGTNVAIFDGVTTIQPINFLPELEFFDNSQYFSNDNKTFEIPDKEM